ncbi:MAG: MarR family transcriptional regulator [Acidimicrobiales bacterium]|jgi:DNA-binding MarR family transcriptional regulator
MSVPDPDEVAARLQRFGLERDRMRASLAHAADISATDLDALEHLEADGPLTQRQLGEKLSLTSGAITMLVDRLERLGLVRRGPHPTDRRYILLELSPEAVERAPAGLATYHARMRALAAETRPEHRGALCSFLLAAANAASEAADELSR